MTNSITVKDLVFAYFEGYYDCATTGRLSGDRLIKMYYMCNLFLERYSIAVEPQVMDRYHYEYWELQSK